LALAGAVAHAAAAGELVQGEKFNLSANGRMQWLGVGQHIQGDARGDARLYLFMKQARLRFSGGYESTKFDLQLAYGGEDVVAVNPGVALGLLDFSFDVPLPARTWLKIGQFRVPYGRERLTDAGLLDFSERSIQSLGFSWNRDVGAALYTQQGKFAGTVGIFTGGGRDVPQRYLPEKLGSPMFVARLGYNDGVDEDLYSLGVHKLEPTGLRKAVFVNGLYVKDSLIGHSTVLNVRSSDKSLLINPNWNPYIARGPLTTGSVWQAGGDAVVRTSLGSLAVSAEAEANYARFQNEYGRLSLKGGRLQVGAARGPVQANLRYARLHLDPNMANTYTPAPGTPARNSQLAAASKPIQELTPSLTYRYRSNVAVKLEMPLYIDMLVFEENGVGSYLANQHPDQAALVKPGTTAGSGSVARRTIPEARILFQLSF
jgi:hypothetical protein